MNHVFVSGKIATEPEARVVASESGTPNEQLAFIVAVERTPGSDYVDFFRVVLYGANAFTYDTTDLLKGAKVLVEGALRQDHYVKGDNARHTVQIVASHIEIL